MTQLYGTADFPDRPGLLLPPQSFVPVIAAAVTFDPANVGTKIILSNGNRDITAADSTTWTTARSTTSKSSGAFYFEILEVLNSGGQQIVYGVCDGTQSGVTAGMDNFPGQFNKSAGFRFNGTFCNVLGTSWVRVAGPTNTSETTGTIIMIAVDVGNGTLWGGINGTWDGSTTPVVGSTTGAFATWPAGTAVYAACAVSAATAIARLGATAAQCTYSPPSGFSNWA